MVLLIVDYEHNDSSDAYDGSNNDDNHDDYWQSVAYPRGEWGPNPKFFKM